MVSFKSALAIPAGRNSSSLMLPLASRNFVANPDTCSSRDRKSPYSAAYSALAPIATRANVIRLASIDDILIPHLKQIADAAKSHGVEDACGLQNRHSGRVADNIGALSMVN